MAAAKGYRLYSHGIDAGLFTQEQITRMTGITQFGLNSHVKTGQIWKDRWTFEKIEREPGHTEEGRKRKLLERYDWDSIRLKLNPYAKGVKKSYGS